MPTIRLKPINDTPSDYDHLEIYLTKVFRDAIYLPIMKLLGAKPEKLENASNALIDAIRSGQIYYADGHFRGRFDAEISKELKTLGARWDRTQGSFAIPQSQLPIDMGVAISQANANLRFKSEKILEILGGLNSAIIAGSADTSKYFAQLLKKTELKFKETTAAVKDIQGITVQPTLTSVVTDKIAEQYSDNLKIYIKKFTAEQTRELRKRVQEHVLEGARYGSLVEEIQKSYGVSQRKAKFLARQETSLMMTAYKQARYQSIGIDNYIWKCVVGSPNHPVRPDHKKNDGKEFSWNNPPTVNAKGDRKNPGQDYNCRCMAIPIVRFSRLDES